VINATVTSFSLAIWWPAGLASAADGCQSST
jgi:hypothetical protein